MPNGESTCVILLEYIEGKGITLDKLQDKYSIHGSPQYNSLLKESYTE